MPAESVKTPVGGTLVDLPIAAVIESADNPRKHFDDAFVAQMAASMREVGQISPALVRPHPTKADRYELVAGATRLRAAKVAKLATLRCVVEPMDDAKFLKAMTFENLKRRDLRPLEEARGYALLMKRLDGYTPQKIAHESGVSVDYVRDRLRLLQLVPAALELLDQDPSPLPLSHALELAKLTPAQQTDILDADEYEEVLWRDEYGVLLEPRINRLEFDEDDTDVEETPRARPRAVVTLAEFRSAIAERFAIDPADAQTAELFPELVAAIEERKAAAAPFVLITDAWSAPDTEKGKPEILGRREWRLADGTKGAPTCTAAVLGLGVHGGVRGMSLTVCTATTTCTKHWADEIAHAKRETASRSSAGAKKPKKREEQPWEREDRLRREAVQAMKPILPQILETLRAKIGAASVKPSGPVATILLNEFGKIAPEAKKAFPDDLLRQMAFSEIIGNSESSYQYNRFTECAKALGVDLKAAVKLHGAAAAKAAAKPAAKKAPAKKAGGRRGR